MSDLILISLSTFAATDKGPLVDVARIGLSVPTSYIGEADHQRRTHPGGRRRDSSSCRSRVLRHGHTRPVASIALHIPLRRRGWTPSTWRQPVNAESSW